MSFLPAVNTETYMKTLAGYMKEMYDWHYSIHTDFLFDGGYNARLNKLYADRMAQYPELGTGANRQIPNLEKSSELDLSLFDESNLEQFQQKVMTVMGCYMGFRGRKEHTYLEVKHIIEGEFEPSSTFAGYPYIGVNCMPDKSKKVTSTNDIARDTACTMRLPIIDIGDMNDPGGTFKRYTGTFHPLQRRRFYCKESSIKMKRIHCLEGYPNARMSFNQPLGENTVAKMIKHAGKITGLGTTGQGIRRLYLTTLVNDPGVSVEEALVSGRHGSVAAQRPYQHRNHQSEGNKFAALGIKRKDGKEDDN